jgi:hypothetical protein
LVVRATDDETNDEVPSEARDHEVPPPQPVHHKRTNHASGQRKRPEEELVLGGLANEFVAVCFDDLRDDGTAEDAVREGDKVIKEPVKGESQIDA